MAEPRKSERKPVEAPRSSARPAPTPKPSPTGKTMQELERMQFDVLDRTGGFER